jgi:hypothetical protein
VTLVRAARARTTTVAETVLLPGETALLAPAWVPWEDRLLPGDLGPGDVLPPAPDDERLVPGWAADELTAFDPEVRDEVWMVAAEAGLGRPRVLSPIGRDDAIDRWYSGDRGPSAAIAAAAGNQCSTCGFLLPMAGSMGRMFGVCANEYAPDDAHVVSLDHGCGAHSEVVATPAGLSDRPSPVLDEIGFDVLGGDGPIWDGIRGVAVASVPTLEPSFAAVRDGDDPDPVLIPGAAGGAVSRRTGVVVIPGAVGSEVDIEWLPVGHDEVGHDEVGHDEVGHDEVGHDEVVAPAAPHASPTGGLDEGEDLVR